MQAQECLVPGRVPRLCPARCRGRCVIPWAELRALGGFVLLVVAVDTVAFAVLLFRAIAE